MLEWMNREIAWICHELDYCLFLNEERRARLKSELSSLLEKREQCRKEQGELANKMPDMLKEST